MSTLLLLAALVGLDDPRILLIELQRDGRLEEALDTTTALIEENPEQARRLGLEYLRGDLLDRLGRREDATEAFTPVMAESSRLAPHARLRIAQVQAQLGHPEVAAGVVANLLGSHPPRALVRPAVELLARSLEGGGDCRLLTNLSSAGFGVRDRRTLELSRARCALRSGEEARGIELLSGLLRDEQKDVVALIAALTLDRFAPKARPDATLLGQTFFYHRQFDRALELLAPANPRTERIRSESDFEAQYRWARCQYWLGQFDEAAQSYGLLAELSVSPHHVARALFHRARSLELAGQWQPAIIAYRNVYAAQPLGTLSADSLLGALRIEWRLGREAQALELYQLLRERPQSRLELSRAALFLAASDLARARRERAAGWLDDAAAASSSARLEVAYWRGRLRELEGHTEDAVRFYLDALEEDYFHPLAQMGLERIDAPDLYPAVAALGARLASGGDPFRVWVLLGAQDPRGAAALRTLEVRASRANRGQPAVPPGPVAVGAWPLWNTTLSLSDELLLAVGLWSEARGVALRHFPVEEPGLALTAALELNRAGEIKESLRIAEILSQRIPDWVAEPVLPRYFRELLYPYPYRYLIERAAARHGVDPLLLVAIVREESRFDAAASSTAAARGLTQFVFATATELAREHGMGPLGPRDLERPEVSLELGAAYLSELARLLGNHAHVMLAAYNAGEPQALLWLRYCFTDDPAEFVTKVSFRETRGYLRKVLSSHAQYRDLYPATTAVSGL